MKKHILALAALGAASPALAQQASDDWTGLYVGGHLGYAFQDNNRDETILFDTNLDGDFADTVNTAAGANAFSPGFCGGSTGSALPANGCGEDNDGTDYGIHAGFDYDLGGIVVGVVGEYGRTAIEDNVTAFSTTPAFYTLTRRLRDSYGIRARAGVDLGGTLVYGTGGLVNGRIRTTQATSNGVNAFEELNGRSREWGYRYGGGIEQKLGSNFSIGVQYLYTRIDDDEASVAVTRGSAPATNPFVLTNAGGTQFRRSDDVFNHHSVQVTANFRF